jgi:O-antigen ligase
MRDANMNSAEVMLTRSVCTVHQVRDFNKGEKVEADGLRLEIYKNTWELIVEKPLLGHGIANWMPLYQAKTKGLISEEMTTPHNEYLLYCTELGVFGMLALIWIWLKQLIVARQMTAGEHHESAMLLAMLGATMILTGSFNAALRDALFGMAFMILLAIPLAGVQKQQAQH